MKRKSNKRHSHWENRMQASLFRTSLFAFFSSFLSFFFGHRFLLGAFSHAQFDHKWVHVCWRIKLLWTPRSKGWNFLWSCLRACVFNMPIAEWRDISIDIWTRAANHHAHRLFRYYSCSHDSSNLWIALALGDTSLNLNRRVLPNSLCLMIASSSRTFRCSNATL